MSAAIAKNMSAIMSQSSELMRGSSTSDTSSFLDNHNHYSFIVVVALMSLFLVVTISATGLLLAFCRKKNTVFVAAPKSDADSQFELDDIESSDIEMCHGDKGECYMHLSDDYDDDEDDYDDDSQSDGVSLEKDTDSKCTRRSRTFPQFLSGCRPFMTSQKSNTITGSDHKVQKTLIPLIPSPKDQQAGEQCCKTHDPSATQREDEPAKQNELPNKVICCNPNHKHHQYYHFNLQNPHHRQSKMYRARILHPTRNSLVSYGAGRLQRSHTIHAIPHTERRNKSHSTLGHQHNKINTKVVNTDTHPHNECCDLSSVSPELTEVSEMYILNGDDYEAHSQIKAPFENLKLLIQDDNDKDNYKDKNDNELLKSSTTPRTDSDANVQGELKCANKLSTCSNPKDGAISEKEHPNTNLTFPRTSEAFSRINTNSDSRSSRTCCTSNISLSLSGTCNNTAAAFSGVADSSPKATPTNLFNISSQSPSFHSNTPAGETLTTAFSEMYCPLSPESVHQSQCNMTTFPNQSQNDTNNRVILERTHLNWGLHLPEMRTVHKNNNFNEGNNVNMFNDQAIASPSTEGPGCSHSLGMLPQSSHTDGRHRALSHGEDRDRHREVQESVLKDDMAGEAAEGNVHNRRIVSDCDSIDVAERCSIKGHDDAAERCFLKDHVIAERCYSTGDAQRLYPTGQDLAERCYPTGDAQRLYPTGQDLAERCYPTGDAQRLYPTGQDDDDVDEDNDDQTTALLK